MKIAEKPTLDSLNGDVHPDWCPGCGDFGVLKSLKEAIVALQIEPHDVLVVSGIGCSSNLPGFIRTYGVHSLHGRSLPVATGAALANHDLNVIAVGGDGTLNEVVNGFFEDDRPINSEATLSLLMSGTGGDFRKTLGLSGDIDEAIEAIVHGSVRRIDVGRLRFIGHDGRFSTRLEIGVSEEDVVFRLTGEQIFQFVKGGVYYGRDPVPAR